MYMYVLAVLWIVVGLWDFHQHDLVITYSPVKVSHVFAVATNNVQWKITWLLQYVKAATMSLCGGSMWCLTRFLK